MEVGYTAKAEAGVYALAMLCGIDRVPPTILKKRGEELLSVQARAGTRDTGAFLQSEEAKQVLVEGKDHPGAESLMEIAVMDYLVNSSDRHWGNLFYDEASKQFHAIDNGYALGLSEPTTERGPTGEMRTRMRPVDGVYSAAVEVTHAHPDWKMSDGLRAKLQRTYDAVSAQLAYRRAMKQGTAEVGVSEEVRAGKEAEAVSEVFRFLHQKEDGNGAVTEDSMQIAKKEMELFLDRLKEVLDHGAVPPFERSDPQLGQQVEKQKARLAAARKVATEEMDDRTRK